jgi:N-carbamoylputrescine amidase
MEHMKRTARPVTVAATQFACTWDREANLDRAEALVRDAAARGAAVILLQELFETPYFPIEQDARHLALAAPVAASRPVRRFTDLARELRVVLPVSFFESAGQVYFNSVAMVDADGSLLGVYRKSHIPGGIGYAEKTYFSPGDTGFRVWETAAGRIGVGICWDQWFPEPPRIMALRGAEILLYPTAIGSEPPPAPPIDSRDHWRRAMIGHAAANLIPVVASNRVGREVAPSGNSTEITFYGSSFIADQTGSLLAEMDRTSEGVITATIDLDAIRLARDDWHVFRDRRPDLYGPLLTLDGGGEG